MGLRAIAETRSAREVPASDEAHIANWGLLALSLVEDACLIGTEKLSYDWASDSSRAVLRSGDTGLVLTLDVFIWLALLRTGLEARAVLGMLNARKIGAHLESDGADWRALALGVVLSAGTIWACVREIVEAGSLDHVRA